MYLNKNKKARNYQNGGDVPSEKMDLPSGVSGYTPSGNPIYTNDKAGEDAQYRDMFSKNRGRLTTPSSKVNKSEGFSDEYNRVLQYKEDNRTIGDNRQIAKLPKWVKGPQEGYGRVVISPEMAMQMKVDINTGKVSPEVAEDYFRFLQGYREGVIGDGIVDYKLDIPENYETYEYEDPQTGEMKTGRRSSNILRGHGYKGVPGQGTTNSVKGYFEEDAMKSLIELSERINNPKKYKKVEGSGSTFSKKDLRLPETGMIKEGYGDIVSIPEVEEEEEEILELLGEGEKKVEKDAKVLNEANKNKLTNQSIGAIVNSFKTGKHIKTGEEYNQADLQRDADIIKKEFGDKAYQDLLAQLTGGPGDTSSDVSAVTTNLNKQGRPSITDSNIMTKGYDVVDFNKLRESIGKKEVEEGETGSRSEQVIAEMNEPEETSSTTYGGSEISTFFPGDYQNLGYYSGMPSSSSSPFKTGGKLNKHNKGGESAKGFYDEGGSLVKGFYSQGGMNYRVPQFYQRGDASLGNPIAQLKAEIAHYKTVYDPNNPAQVAKLDEMEARLDKMTLYKVERTNILDTTDADAGVDVETETQE